MARYHCESQRPQPSAQPARRSKPLPIKKSINLWAFPYPDTMSLAECFTLAKRAGFDGIEINFALDGEFSAESTDEEITETLNTEGKLEELAKIVKPTTS